MRDAFFTYLTEWESLEAFSRQHFVTLFVSMAMVVAVPYLSRSRLSTSHQIRLGIAIGWLPFVSYMLWAGAHLLAGSFDIQRHLPLHLCYVVGLLTPVAMIWRREEVFEFLYYCAFSGVLQACLSPDECAQFPHFEFFRFWVLHIGVILSAVYAVIVFDMWPKARGVFRTWVCVLAFLVLSVVVNLVFGTNYFYVCAKPPQSLLNYFGEWPWYIIVAIPWLTS